MKCPLLAISEGPLAAVEAIPYPDCLKEKCAWWMRDFSRCCILDGVLCLNILMNKIGDLTDAVGGGKKG